MIVKSVDDLKLLDDQVQEIELVEFSLLAIEVDLLKRFGELLSLTCTKMYLNDLEFIPKTIQNLAFYNCFIEKMDALKYFTNLYTLSITDCNISIEKIINSLNDFSCIVDIQCLIVLDLRFYKKTKFS